MKKTFLIITILAISLSTSFSQRLKYDNIFELILNRDYARAYSLLFDYQQTDPEFPNTYFQLGEMSYNWAFEADPFKNLEQAEYYIHNTKLFFGLAISKLVVQERDAKKNTDLYLNIYEFKQYKKLDNEIVIEYIDKKMKIINDYDSSMHNSVRLLNKTIDSYKKTVQLYTNIITIFPNISDLYLIQKDSILQSTNKLIINYDSTLFYFKKFKKSLSKNPILDYKQKLYTQPIKTYRLQGLTKTNFLNDSLIIWDYKNWAKNIQKELNSNINHFRETIAKTNKALTEKENKISNYHKNTNIFNPVSLEQKIIFEIEKFDNNSLITKLFAYKIARVNLLVLYKRVYNDVSDNNIAIHKRQKELYNLVKYKIKTDSLLNIFEANINKKDYLKHKDFFDINYNKFEGISTFTKTQKSSNDKILDNSINNALFFTLRDIYNVLPKNRTIKYKDTTLNINISVKEPKYASEKNYITTSVAINKKGEKYITGYYKTTSGSSAFIAKISDDNLEWMKTSPSGVNVLEYGTKIHATFDGCFVIIHSVNNSKHYNTIVKLSTSGKQIFKYNLSNQAIARKFIYDEINNNAIIAFQGQKLNYFDDKSDELHIEKLNLRKNAVTSWKKTIILDGNIINIIKIDTNYHIFANYHLLKIDNKNIINNDNKIMHLTTDLKFNYINAKNVKSDSFIFGYYAYKINSNIISVVGTAEKTDIYNLQDITKIPPCNFLIIDKNNKTILNKQ